MTKLERFKDNEAIIKLLLKYLIDNPDQRFTQALVNLDIAKTSSYVSLGYDESFTYNHVNYYEEPKNTLKIMKKTLKKLNKKK